jgi:hypothetical protein
MGGGVLGGRQRTASSVGGDDALGGRQATSHGDLSVADDSLGGRWWVQGRCG